MIYLTNAFSLQMVHSDCKVSIKTIPASEVAKRLEIEEWVSSMGHQDIAAVATDMLGHDVHCNRSNIALREGDTLFVAQVIGGRLPEGATKLPSGFTVIWKQVEIV